MAPPGVGTEVEGLHAVAAAVAAGRVRVLFIEAGRADELRDLAVVAAAAGADVRVVPDLGPRAATTAPQGVVAHCAPLETRRLVDLAQSGGPPALLVLDHLEDPRNVGAAARSARAAEMTGLVLARRRAAPLGATAFKAAAGALETLPVALVSSVAQALDDLARLDVWRVGLDADGEQRLFGLDLLAEPVAVVVGAEGGGLGRLVAGRVDVRASIPLAPGVESLNAAVAASLACYEVLRVRGAARGRQ